MGRPAETLVEFTRDIGASLVVMGAVSKGALELLLIGNTAEKVLDDLSCDILVVKSEPLETRVAAELCMACLWRPYPSQGPLRCGSAVWECTRTRVRPYRGWRLHPPQAADGGYTRRRVSREALFNTGRVAMSPKVVTPRLPPTMS